MAQDISISLGLDYGAFVAQANGASRKVVEQSLKQFALHAKQASVLAGAGAARSTAASGLLASLAAPVTAPFKEAHVLLQNLQHVAAQSARNAARTFNREFQLAPKIAAVFAPLKTRLEPFTKAAAAGLGQTVAGLAKERAQRQQALQGAADDVAAATTAYQTAQAKYNQVVAAADAARLAAAQRAAAKQQPLVTARRADLTAAQQPIDVAQKLKKQVAEIGAAKAALDKARAPLDFAKLLPAETGRVAGAVQNLTRPAAGGFGSKEVARIAADQNRLIQPYLAKLREAKAREAQAQAASAALAAQLDQAQVGQQRFQDLRATVKTQRSAVAQELAKLTQMKQAPDYKLSQVGRWVGVGEDPAVAAVQAQEKKLRAAQARLRRTEQQFGAAGGGARTGGTLTAMQANIAQLRKRLAQAQSQPASAARQQEIDTAQAALKQQLQARRAAFEHGRTRVAAAKTAAQQVLAVAQAEFQHKKALLSGANAAEQTAAKQRLDLAKGNLREALAGARQQQQQRVQAARDELAHALRTQRAAVAAAKTTPSPANQKRVAAAATKVTGAREELTSAHQGLAQAQTAATGFLGKLKQIGQYVVAGLGTAFRVFSSVALSIFNVLKVAVLGLVNILRALARTAFTVGLVLGTIFAIGLARAINFGKELDALSRRYQFATRDIEAMRLALFRSNQTAASAAGIMDQFRQSLYFGAGPELFQNLGFDLAQLQALLKTDPTAAFAQLAEVVNRIENPIVRAKIATTLLGQAGADALAQFQAGDANLSPVIKKYLDDVTRGASGLQMAADHWKRIRLSAEVFFDSVALKVAPVLESIAKFFEETLLPLAQQWGATLGDKLTAAVQTALGLFQQLRDKSVSIGEILRLAFTIAALALRDTLIRVFDFTYQYLAALLNNPALWTGMKDGIVWAFQTAAPVAAELIGKAVGAALGLAQNFMAARDLDAAKEKERLAAEGYGNLRREREERIAAGTWTTHEGPDSTGRFSDESNYKAKVKANMQAIAEAQAAQQKLKPALDRSVGESSKNMGDWARDTTAGLVGTPQPGALQGALANIAAAIPSLETVARLWAETAGEESEALRVARANLKKILDEAQTAGAAATAGTGADKKPGQKGPGPAIGMVQTRFDDLRRVGAGLSSSAGNAMESLARKQLSVQESIEKNTRLFQRNRPDKSQSITSFAPMLAN